MKKIAKSEFDTILRIVAPYPEGASLEDLLASSELSLGRRTLQRRLTVLITRGDLRVEGHTRSRRYRLVNPPENSLGVTKTIVPTRTNAILLSTEAEIIQEKVRQPIELRRHVSYNREFLDKYRPNETYYLSVNIRERLLELGKSSNGDRPAGTYAKRILHRLLIDLSWNSSRLEGNTYSLLETQRLLELGEAAEGKNAKEATMILNHKEAIEFLVESAEEIDVNRFTILNLHALLSNNLLSNPKACGSIREIPVGIAKSVYHPLELRPLIDEYFNQLLATAKAIKDPFEQSFFLLVQLPYLQPFEDVNKRVSRLAANLPFICKNLCPISFIDVPEVAYINGLIGIYELNRVELLRDVFVWAYERSSSIYSATRQALGEPDPFRVRYRTSIAVTVAEVVRGLMDRGTAAAAIKQRALEDIPAEDKAKFIEVVETEIMSLHEGNIARYRLRPSEYEAWRKMWR